MDVAANKKKKKEKRPEPRRQVRSQSEVKVLLIPNRSHITDPEQEVLLTGRVRTICTLEQLFIFTVNSSFGFKCVPVCVMRFRKVVFFLERFFFSQKKKKKVNIFITTAE